MTESKRKETYDFNHNLNYRTNLLEEMAKQDKPFITRSKSNLNKCGSQQINT